MKLVQQAQPILLLLGLCAALIAALVWLVSGGFDQLTNRSTTVTEGELASVEPSTYHPTMTNRKNPIARLETNYGSIDIELFTDTMPITAGNFEKLVKEEFYNGVQFHRVIENFMIQGGDPNTKTDNILTYGQGNPGYTIPDEHIAGAKMTNLRGTVAMANSGPESGGSQFFINTVDNQRLDFDKAPLSSQHPVFGKVINGMDVVDHISAVAANPQGLPLEPVVIERATIVSDDGE